MREVHCEVATNYDQCFAFSAMYGAVIIVSGAVIYVTLFLECDVGFLGSVGILPVKRAVCNSSRIISSMRRI